MSAPNHIGQLPAHRSAQAGRTWSRSWSPAEFDPIERPDAIASAGHALVTLIGIALLVGLLAWIAITWGTR